VVILWYLIVWEALVGAALFFVLVAFQTLLAKKSVKLRDRTAAFNDKRLVVMNEIISRIRAVKMYAYSRISETPSAIFAGKKKKSGTKRTLEKYTSKATRKPSRDRSMKRLSCDFASFGNKIRVVPSG